MKAFLVFCIIGLVLADDLEEKCKELHKDWPQDALNDMEAEEDECGLHCWSPWDNYEHQDYHAVEDGTSCDDYTEGGVCYEGWCWEKEEVEDIKECREKMNDNTAFPDYWFLHEEHHEDCILHCESGDQTKHETYLRPDGTKCEEWFWWWVIKEGVCEQGACKIDEEED